MLTTLQSDTDLRRWCIQEAKDIVQLEKQPNADVIEKADELYNWIKDDKVESK